MDQSSPTSIAAHIAWHFRRMKSFKMNAVNLFVLVMVMIGLIAEGESTPCARTFYSALVQLVPCRSAVSSFSPLPPSEACCTALKTLGQACLCELISGPPISGIDRSLALQLPEKCTANFGPCDIMKK